MSRYRTIVADPPWDHSDATGRDYGSKDARRKAGFKAERLTAPPYPSMTVTEIAALPVRDLSASDAHLYLWTTNRYLHDAFHICEQWGFRVSKPLIWCKQPMGFFGGTYVSSAEFVLFARRGSLTATGRVDRQWWSWPRGSHSQKPEAFLDQVEQVSPGPYLELFARRARLGWDVWGNEVDSHVEMTPTPATGGTA